MKKLLSLVVCIISLALLPACWPCCKKKTCKPEVCENVENTTSSKQHKELVDDED